MIRVHHVGYLVKNPDRARAHFAVLGFAAQSGPVQDTLRGVDILFLEKDGHLVELVTPISAESVVSNLMRARKNSPYHLCCCSDDFENDMRKLEQSGFTRVDEPLVAPAIQNRRVCFFVSAQIGLVELLESAE